MSEIKGFPADGVVQNISRGFAAFGSGCLAAAVAVGVYTATARQPDCAAIYTCRRVVDRTTLLGWTVTVSAVGALIVLCPLWVAGRRATTQSQRVIGVLLLLSAGALVASYHATHFVSLRADLITAMPASSSMWTASAALWQTVIGLVGVGIGSFHAMHWTWRSAAISGTGALFAVTLTAATVLTSG
jgi:hypothetical protein